MPDNPDYVTVRVIITDADGSVTWHTFPRCLEPKQKLDPVYQDDNSYDDAGIALPKEPVCHAYELTLTVLPDHKGRIARSTRTAGRKKS